MAEWTRVEDALPEPYKDCYVTYEFKSGFRRVIESYIDTRYKWAFLEKALNTKGTTLPRRAVAWMYKVKPAPYEDDRKVVEDENS